nr:hypothetical protein [uncultured Rhodopila sp.]
MNREKARQSIDRMVDFRKRFACHDSSPIKVNLTPKEMHDALGLPSPPRLAEYPFSCLYRGYRIESKAKVPA